MLRVKQATELLTRWPRSGRSGGSSSTPPGVAEEKNATVALWEKSEEPLLQGEGTDFQRPLAFKYCLNGFLMSCSPTLSR